LAEVKGRAVMRVSIARDSRLKGRARRRTRLSGIGLVAGGLFLRVLDQQGQGQHNRGHDEAGDFDGTVAAGELPA
jgi:hypothetical protein